MSSSSFHRSSASCCFLGSHSCFAAVSLVATRHSWLKAVESHLCLLTFLMLAVVQGAAFEGEQVACRSTLYQLHNASATAGVAPIEKVEEAVSSALSVTAATVQAVERSRGKRLLHEMRIGVQNGIQLARMEREYHRKNAAREMQWRAVTDAASGGIVTDVDPERNRKQNDLQHTGTLSFYTEEAILQRLELRYAPEVLEPLQAFWSTALLSRQERVHDSSLSAIDRAEYGAIHYLAYRLLVEEWDEGEAEETLREDWLQWRHHEVDGGNGQYAAAECGSADGDDDGTTVNTLSRTTFCDSMFEYADNWTLSIGAEVYGDYLWRLFHAMAVECPDGKYRWRPLDEVSFEQRISAHDPGEAKKKRLRLFDHREKLENVKSKVNSHVAGLIVHHEHKAIFDKHEHFDKHATAVVHSHDAGLILHHKHKAIFDKHKHYHEKSRIDDGHRGASHFHERRHAVLLIQGAWRGAIARRRVRRLKQSHAAHRLHHAHALSIHEKELARERMEVQHIMATRFEGGDASLNPKSRVLPPVTNPRRLTPRFRCKTPSWGGPLYSDNPLLVPLPAGIHHENFGAAAVLGAARWTPTAPPLPRRFAPVYRSGRCMTPAGASLRYSRMQSLQQSGFSQVHGGSHAQTAISAAWT